MTDETPLQKIPIIVDTGRTNFRIGYGGDEKPRSINQTVYWQDPQTGKMNYSLPPIDKSVPVYSLFSTFLGKPLTLDNFTSSRLPDSDKLLDYIEYHTLELLNLKENILQFPFLFSREDRSDKIQYPEPKKEKNGERKDYMEIVKQ